MGRTASPWIEYLVALFFESAPLGNLIPQQMDLLYRLLRWLEPQYMVQDSFSSQSPYHTRLDKAAPPVKTTDAPPADSPSSHSRSVLASSLT